VRKAFVKRLGACVPDPVLAELAAIAPDVCMSTIDM
jgi:hypothetical protein